mgnify:CR=1 FL=1
MNTSTFKVALRGLARRKFFTFISLFGIAFTLLMILVVSSVIDHAVGSHPPGNARRPVAVRDFADA